MPTYSKPQSAQSTAQFQYFLWRRKIDRNIFHGYYPEIIVTNGDSVHRLSAMDRQILYQEFNAPELAHHIIRRVQAGANRGVQLVGYTMMKNQDAVAILQTGTPHEPGWLAVPDVERTLHGEIPTAIPPSNPYDAGLRLLAGASITWQNREMQLNAALEQRLDRLPAGQKLPNLIDYIADWTLHASYVHNNENTPIRLARKSKNPVTPFRASEHRLETQFTIEPNIFREFSQKSSFQIWFQIQLKRDLFCLPEQWNSVWIAVNPAMNP